MSTKVMKTINVSTAPNGYTLKIDDNEFFYFNEVDLLAGFLARVGSGNTKEMEKCDILNTLFNVMLGEKYARDIDNLNATVERLEQKYSERIARLEELITIINDATDKHQAMKAQLEETTKLTNEIQKGYAEALKPFKEYEQRIGQLEAKTQNMETRFKTATNQANDMLQYIDARIAKVTESEKLLNSKARMLVERLDMRLRMADTLYAEEPSEKYAEEPAVDVLEEVVVETPVKTPKKIGRPRKTGGDTKTTRQKRDEEILKKMTENPNIK